MEGNWFYVDSDGQPKGPVPQEEISRIVAMLPDVYLFREGMSDWAKASTLPELAANRKWQVEPATEKQKGMLILHTVRFNENISKGEASALIETIKSEARQPSATGQAEYKKWREAIERTNAVKTLESLKNKIGSDIDHLQQLGLLAKNYDQVRSSLKESLEQLIEICKERKEDAKEIEWEKRDRIKQYMEFFNSGWEMMFKKPTRQQVQDLIAELERLYPEQFYHEEKLFFEHFERLYPELRRR